MDASTLCRSKILELSILHKTLFIMYAALVTCYYSHFDTSNWHLLGANKKEMLTYNKSFRKKPLELTVVIVIVHRYSGLYYTTETE